MEDDTAQAPVLSRRSVIGGLGAIAVLTSPSAALALGEMISPSDIASAADLQEAIDRSTIGGHGLQLAAGEYPASGLRLPAGCHIIGVPGRTRLLATSGKPILMADNASDITLEGLVLDERGLGDTAAHRGAASFVNCTGLTLSRLAFENTRGNGLYCFGSSGTIRDCSFAEIGLTAVFLYDGRGMLVTGNSIRACGTGGIRVFRAANGHDGSIVTENRIAGIRSPEGNGQNGNGINAYFADEVVIADNVISDCDFSAIRVNSTNNAVIRGNTCTQCREVAIFSEFAFSGSSISGNIVDGAAAGISMTNLDSGGRIAVCSGNIVRDIWERSPTNPDTTPFGIFAEAEAAITGNVVQSVPGPGIAAGWGPFLSNVLINGNIVRDTRIGIAASVADGAGAAHIKNNMIAGTAEAPIAAMRWREVVADLSRVPNRFPNLSLEGNTVTD